VKYESHLMGWHNIADKRERKLAITRTMNKLINNNEIAGQDEDNAQQQFTFESEDYVVSASFLGNYPQEEVASNPDATIVARVEGDFDVDDSENYVLESGNIEFEGAQDDLLQVHSVENTFEGRDDGDDDTSSAPIETSAREGFAMFNDTSIVDASQLVCVQLYEEGDGKDNSDIENGSSHDTSEGVDKEGNYITSEDVEKESDDVTINDVEKESDDVTSEGGLVRDCSVKMTKLKKSLIRTMADADISVPWYECGHHVCVECGSVVFLGSLERHLSLHDISLLEYKKQHKIPERELYITSYDCLVCGVAVLHTNKKIMTHLKLHNIDMGSYYFQYVQGDGGMIKPETVVNTNTEEVEDIVEKHTSKKLKKNVNLSEDSPYPSSISIQHLLNSAKKKRLAFTSTGASPRTPASKKSRLSLESPSTLPWYESSWHTCMECNKVTTMGKFFISHVKQDHRMTKKEYLEKYPEDEVDNTPNWECGVCGKGVSWCVRSIAAHLSKAHSMLKEDYATNYIDTKDPNDDEDKFEESPAKVGTQGRVLEEVPLSHKQDLQVVFDKYCDDDS